MVTAEIHYVDGHCYARVPVKFRLAFNHVMCVKPPLPVALYSDVLNVGCSPMSFSAFLLWCLFSMCQGQGLLAMHLGEHHSLL